MSVEAPAALMSSRSEARRVSRFPVVGIGCSAGGLEALEAFFASVKCDCGMAFIIVQHLDPKHPSNLPQLLQRVTPLPVVEAAEGMAVGCNRVYVIPPNKDLALHQGKLHLYDPTERRGLRLPIDYFLRTLADDCGDRAVGVVLSGMGSDGMLGLGAIKGKSGLTLAQTPATAGADSMPSSAIKACVVDIVAPPADLPARIANYLQILPPGKALAEGTGHSALEGIIALLRARSGNDFSQYKPSTLYRRIERRMALLQIDGIAKYLKHLPDNPQELDLLYRELLIGVTHFFRDPAVWEFLQTAVLPALLARHRGGKDLRCWVAACSSGEEAYTVAILFKEVIDQLKPNERFSLQIYATDLDTDAVDRARRAFYPDSISTDVSPPRLARYFTRERGGYRVAKSLRDMVIFAPQNVISDPPFTHLDLLCCRNLLIYFGPELQKRLLPLFHYALNRDGILVLGTAETVGGFTDLFQAMDAKAHIYQRISSVVQPYGTVFPARGAAELPPVIQSSPAVDRESLAYLTDQLIQQKYAPAAVLVNRDGDILYISGRTGKYLEPAAGKVNINIHAMARDGLRQALAGAIHAALGQSQPIHLNGLSVDSESGGQMVDVTVQGIERPEVLQGRALIVFSDVRNLPADRKSRKKSPLESDSGMALELKKTQQALQVSREEMRASLEEAISANEELQAANEELSTSKEELQSMNEELQTVNAELQSRVDELILARNDMNNLLDSTQIATIFLDNDIRLRRFTSGATPLFKFIPGDVGRPLADIVSDLDYPQLQADALAVLSSQVFRETQARSRAGAWYRVRIMPYYTQDRLIDGVVITFVDITEIKQLEALAGKAEAGQGAPQGA